MVVAVPPAGQLERPPPDHHRAGGHQRVDHLPVAMGFSLAFGPGPVGRVFVLATNPDGANRQFALQAGRRPAEGLDMTGVSEYDVAEPEWEDLAQRQAGALAREQAVALREAAPVRSLLARVLGVHTDERAWRIGADGEQKVAAQLAKLAAKDGRWQSLHALPVGDRGSDIDHLVIGPGGVFSLNAKHHPGSKIWVGGNTLMVNGRRLPYVRNARFEAQRASRLLSETCGFPVFVRGVVVPVGADDVTIKTPPKDVSVVNRMQLVRWLRSQPDLLTADQTRTIFAAARRSTTWQPTR